MSRLINMTGQQFGRLTVVKRDLSIRSHGGTHWICRCSCGRMVSVVRGSLIHGVTRSCGCLHRESATRPRQRRRRSDYEIPREKELAALQAVADGLNYAQVSVRLEISQACVGALMQQLRRRLGIPTTAGVVAHGFRIGLIE